MLQRHTEDGEASRSCTSWSTWRGLVGAEGPFQNFVAIPAVDQHMMGKIPHREHLQPAGSHPARRREALEGPFVPEWFLSGIVLLRGSLRSGNCPLIQGSCGDEVAESWLVLTCKQISAPSHATEPLQNCIPCLSLRGFARLLIASWRVLVHPVSSASGVEDTSEASILGICSCYVSAEHCVRLKRFTHRRLQPCQQAFLNRAQHCLPLQEMSAAGIKAEGFTLHLNGAC